MSLVLVPGNWLYNAGVIGFLRVMETLGENVEGWLKDDGTVEVKFDGDPEHLALRWFDGLYELFFEILTPEKAQEWEEKVRACMEEGLPEERCRARTVWGTLFNVYARGLFNADLRRFDDTWHKFVRFVSWAVQDRTTSREEISCSFCSRPLLEDERKKGKPFLTSEHIKLLGASPAEVPNSFWNYRSDLAVCSTCTWMILSYPVGILKGKKERYFLNAPSFRLMWVLNRVMRSVFSPKGERTLRELFGTTLMETALRHQLILHHWSMMNVEIVTFHGKQVDSHALPPDRVAALTNPRVASLLKSLGNTEYLSWVLDGREERLLDRAQKLIRESLKKEQSTPKEVQELLELYTLIREIKTSTGGLVYG